MASVQYLFSFNKTFCSELVNVQKHLTEIQNFRIPYIILIQRIFRGYIERKKYNKTHNGVIIIQKYYRGWKTRKMRKYYKEQHAEDVAQKRIRLAAIKIQAWWRGVTERKYLRFKNMLPGDRIEKQKQVQSQNQEMAEGIRELFDETDRESKEVEELAAQQEAISILFKCHHLLRTHKREGIYSCHGSKKLSLIEQLMSKLPYTEYMNSVHDAYKMLVKKNRRAEENTKKTNAQRKNEEALARTLVVQPRSVVQLEKDKMHRKPFKLCSKVANQPYVPSIFLNNVEQKKFKDPSVIHKEKNFHLSAKLDLRDRGEPYYIDFWESEAFKKSQNKNVFF